MKLAPIIKRTQKRFRGLLRIAKCEQEIKQARAWREECAQRQRWWDACRGTYPVKITGLVAMLRQLAGLNANPPSVALHDPAVEVLHSMGTDGTRGQVGGYNSIALRAWEDSS